MRSRHFLEESECQDNSVTGVRNDLFPARSHELIADHGHGEASFLVVVVLILMGILWFGRLIDCRLDQMVRRFFRRAVIHIVSFEFWSFSQWRIRDPVSGYTYVTTKPFLKFGTDMSRIEALSAPILKNGRIGHDSGQYLSIPFRKSVQVQTGDSRKNQTESGNSRGQPLNFLTTTVALWPPKPNELLMKAEILRSLASLKA